MAKVSRLGGAILAITGNDYFLIGDLKEPLDFVKAGFVTPPVISGKDTPYVRLTRAADGALQVSGEFLTMELEGEDLAKKLVSLFVIHRNGSISERLWRLVTESSKSSDRDTGIAARWLGETPDEIWEAVRDSVLRC